jgi:pimeloyl-ACP methyl ester carboxylesterase
MTMLEPIRIVVGESSLFGDRDRGEGPTVVLLHAGVSDRRSWKQVSDGLHGNATVVTYDRRGFGETPPSSAPFSHVDDLISVLDQTTDGPAWLVGSSAGGKVALDAAFVVPDRLAGLILIAPAVSGAPEPVLDPDTARIEPLLDQAYDDGDMDEVNRLETWIWLDGPAQPEGRVGGAPRALALDMNAAILANDASEGAGDSGVDAWARLDEMDLPVTVACGELDVPFMVERSRQLAERLPNSRHLVLGGVAHLPQLEQPPVVTRLILEAVRCG